MELRQLQYFVRVVELGSLSKAAAALHIAQPAISRQVRKLEEEFGGQLLIRDGRGVKPTALGLEFAERARAILGDVKRLKADATGAHGEPMDELTVGIPAIVGSEFIAELVKRFRTRYAKATLRVVEGFSYQIVDWLQLGRLDLGIVYAPAFYKKVDVRPIADQSLHLVGHPSKADIVKKNSAFASSIALPLILPVRPNSFWDALHEAARERELEINLQIEVDSIFAIRKLVKLGEGFSIMPYSGVHEDVQRGELVAQQIRNPVLSKPIAIVFPRRGINTLTGEKLVELIDELSQEFIQRGNWASGEVKDN